MTLNIICAATCVYLLLGVTWSVGYTIIELNNPGSFVGIKDLTNITDIEEILVHYLTNFLYYSYITLTTLGYGNIYPVTSAGSALASLEALLGQLYITILIGRLVGMHIAEHHDQTHNHSDND